MLNIVKSRFFSGKKTFTIFTIAVYLLLSHTSLAQWTQVSNGMGNITVYSLAVSNSNIFAGSDSGVYLSTNNGSTWTQTSLNNQNILSLVVGGTYILAGTRDSGLYLSTDNGRNWNQALLLSYKSIASLATCPNGAGGINVFVGTTLGIGYPGGVFRSTNDGFNWTQTLFLEENRGARINSIVINDSNVFAGEYYYDEGVECGILFHSTNKGETWTWTSLNYQPIYSLAVNPNRAGSSYIFAGTYGVYLSTNNGQTWTQTTLNNLPVYSLAVSGSYIFAGTAGYGVYLSTNNGQNWMQWNEGGMENKTVNALAVTSEYIFAGTENSVWRRPLSDIIVGVKTIGRLIPEQYNLYQNYPNPFNPSTTIKFEIPKDSYTELKIYDILGREVSTLINKQLKPGIYEIEWNASDYPGGTYFYKITTNNFSETKKAILIK